MNIFGRRLVARKVRKDCILNYTTYKALMNRPGGIYAYLKGSYAHIYCLTLSLNSFTTSTRESLSANELLAGLEKQIGDITGLFSDIPVILFLNPARILQAVFIRDIAPENLLDIIIKKTAEAV
ncbi:MAG: hypothetical protein JW969_20185 [Spirochaetales bacterium]|nr:hypothetical protein [Spirochaetales bacterium]